MDTAAFLAHLRAQPSYRDQIVHVHEEPARAARYADDEPTLSAAARALLAALGVTRLYRHQAEALAALAAGRDVLLTTGTASGKSLCYLLPIVEALQADNQCRALLLFPTKALAQDQCGKLQTALRAAGLNVPVGVYDGDTPTAERRRLRDRGRVLCSNPDMVHAALMPQHWSWSPFLSGLRFVVWDELHTYGGLFGSNVANLWRRLERLWPLHGRPPQVIACSGSLGNPLPFARQLLGREPVLVDQDGSPRGRRVFVLWNPPRLRDTPRRSRRSANAEATELVAELVRRGAPTVCFSKAKVTAELIGRYVRENLAATAPALAERVTAYRGGYLAPERRAIEQRLFGGELLAVSTTRALELGIDVGPLEACVIVGYPGTLAGFQQQAGRAGRREADAVVVLVGLDTTVNQYVLEHPDYLFGRPVEETTLDPDNPFVALGHVACAAHELAISAAETTLWGPHTRLVLDVLERNHKLAHGPTGWTFCALDLPQHEVGLRGYVEDNIVIQDLDSGTVLGQMGRLDAPPILHPGAIYFHQGDSYRVESLDLDATNQALVRRVEVDYYTQPCDGTDVHHIDAALLRRPLGAGEARWGEVTAYFHIGAYERVRHFELDAISCHPLQVPDHELETVAFWLIPPDEVIAAARAEGLPVRSGLRGIGFATRMLLPLFVSCQTLDLSHSVGCNNAPPQAVFIYERAALGLGFTRRAFDRLGEILPQVLAMVAACDCDNGCPCCVGKPLRGYATWNVERGEASIPSKSSALFILRGMLGDGSGLNQPAEALLDPSAPELEERLALSLRRQLERRREPRRVLHPIEPEPEVAPPVLEPEASLDVPDAARRREHRDESLRERLKGRKPRP